jgi:hypothetical protein
MVGLVLPPSKASGYYHSPVIWGVVGLLVFTTVLCTLSSRNKRSKLFSHIGFCLLALGACLSGLFGVRGMVTLPEGGSAKAFLDEKGQQRELPGQLELRRFEIDTYGQDLGELVVAEQDSSEQWASLARMTVTRGATQDLAGWRVTVLETQSGPEGNMVMVRVQRGDESFERPLFSSMPMLHSELPDGRRLVYLYEPDVKSYRSTLDTTTSNGQKRTLVVEVNRPGSWQGWGIFQSSYQVQEGRFSSTLEVVKDPGIPAVFLGYLLIVLGAVLGLSGTRRGG